MACHACEQRRIIGRLSREAFVEWTKNPMTTRFMEILERLRREAIARGELDDGPL